MQWLECTVPGGDDPEELCNALAELGVGGMSIENERDFHDFLENNRACFDIIYRKKGDMTAYAVAAGLEPAID